MRKTAKSKEFCWQHMSMKFLNDSWWIHSTNSSCETFSDESLNSLEIRNISWSKISHIFTCWALFEAAQFFGIGGWCFGNFPFPIPKLLECGTCWWLDLVHILLDHHFLVVIVLLLWCNSTSRSVLDNVPLWDLVCKHWPPFFGTPKLFVHLQSHKKSPQKHARRWPLWKLRRVPWSLSLGEIPNLCGENSWWSVVDWWDIDECVTQGRPRMAPAKMEIFFW